jgi:hypothetical protein
MTKIELMIVKTVAERHDVPEDLAARWVRSVVEQGPDSVYFTVVAPAALEVVRPLWDMVKKTISVWAPLLTESVEPEPGESPLCAAAVVNENRRPSDDTLVCPMSGNVTSKPIYCRNCQAYSFAAQGPAA